MLSGSQQGVIKSVNIYIYIHIFINVYIYKQHIHIQIFIHIYVYIYLVMDVERVPTRCYKIRLNNWKESKNAGIYTSTSYLNVGF
jgi:hypothetical protein